MRALIAPSLLSCDFANLEREVAAVTAGGADYIHVDVMDGHFVPNITIGIPVVSSLKKVSKVPLDVHLMISNPLKYARSFAQAGSDIITFHIESEDDPGKTIVEIHDAGAKAGMAVRPGTPWEGLLPYIKDLDLVLVMTVEPGFGGQSFMADMCSKISAVRSYCSDAGICPVIEVDGGINAQSAPLVIKAGANLLVAGSAVFGASDYAGAIAKLRA